MNTGKVKFYNSEKHFGFITPDEGGNDIFFHSSGIASGSVTKDDKVSYDIEEGKKGPQATGIKRVS